MSGRLKRKSYAHASRFARGANVRLGANLALTLDTQSILDANPSSLSYRIDSWNEHHFIKG